jgi:hypothetical protein
MKMLRISELWVDERIYRDRRVGESKDLLGCH